MNGSLESDVMLALVLVQIVLILLLPIGFVYGLFGILRWRRIPFPAFLMVAAAIPALFFCMLVWPPDFLGPLLGRPNPELHMRVVSNDYEVELVQHPGKSFYESYFEVKRPDGKLARVSLDTNDSKWWNPRIERSGDRLYFRGETFGLLQRDAFLDLQQMSLHSPADRATYKLTQLAFGELDAAPPSEVTTQ